MARHSAIIIGAGFGGLATACLLANDGWKVTVLEKNDQLGGRAGWFEENGYKYDTGPSWYLMTDVFERFFQELGENIHEHVKLQKLSPSFRVFFEGQAKPVDIHSDLARDRHTFEAIEKNAGSALEQYLQQSRHIYETATDKFLYKNYDSLKDFFTPSLLREAPKLNVLSNLHDYVSKYFHSSELQKIMEYPAMFLGTSPFQLPAFYSFLNHVLFDQGVFYPKGGMYGIVQALEQIARSRGVKFKLNSPAEKILVENGKATGAIAKGKEYRADVVISNADMHYTETSLLDARHQDHSEKYWQTRTLAPSALLMYLGISKQYDNLRHHNLVFASNWTRNFSEIFDGKEFPTDLSFYVCVPSRTDNSVAPKGKENMFVLVPLPAGLNYTERQLNKFSTKILETMESSLGLQNFCKHIEYKRLFAVKDFEDQFNSYQGTGLGLAHTLRQSAVFRPSNKSRKVKNLYFVGANTHPGIGLPACLISAQLVSQRLL